MAHARTNILCMKDEHFKSQAGQPPRNGDTDGAAGTVEQAVAYTRRPVVCQLRTPDAKRQLTRSNLTAKNEFDSLRAGDVVDNSRGHEFVPGTSQELHRYLSDARPPL